ncbi:MAG TPA: TonB family protein [Chitinophagaceae bacterium]|nr:TonB family protein [Chitinophagaceae bacterium]
MTNKEILRADLLDIIFEKRNKDYGAYAIRRGYHHRLLAAIGVAMSVILLFVFINAFGKKNVSSIPVNRDKRIVEITEVKLPMEKPKEPEKPAEAKKPVQKIATEKFVSKIEIIPDEKVKETLPDVTSLGDKMISDKTEDGKKDDGIPKEKEKPKETGNGIETAIIETQPDFDANEREPEFPGGPEGLKRFLAKNLSTPSELEDGEKKTVHIRFKVDKDGAVNTFEIITSGGNEFDNEVVRVCKKMPRWIPALQNGINVPVSYVLPVTFIGVEQ